jgi:hypothetical protein
MHISLDDGVVLVMSQVMYERFKYACWHNAEQLAHYGTDYD